MLILPQTWLWSARTASNFFEPFRFSSQRLSRSSLQKRPLLTLAIETSCDDTAVAILEKRDARLSENPQDACAPTATLHFNEKITADNLRFRGIHPIVSQLSHHKNLSTLIAKSLQSLPPLSSSTDKQLRTIPVLSNGKWIARRKPDFISVTRGPGMLSCLNTGNDTAKGLAVAWGVPLVGVNHMQAHALTPRLVSAQVSPQNVPIKPSFPFLSLLVSGGHTLLVHSQSTTTHSILASTSDMAVGDAIDKISRSVLPEPLLQASEEIMYGRLLEQFAFPNGASDHHYTAPASRQEEISRKQTRWGWSLPVPFAETRSGAKVWTMEYTFSGLSSTVKRICGEEQVVELCAEERIELAREAMRVAFEHLASRVVLALGQMKQGPIGTLVLSGGVASNKYLKTVLRSFLDAKGYSYVQLSYPPPALCTDNAAMIAWTGMEMFENGWETELTCDAIKIWSIDPAAQDGGILGANGWKMTGQKHMELSKHPGRFFGGKQETKQKRKSPQDDEFEIE